MFHCDQVCSIPWEIIITFIVSIIIIIIIIIVVVNVESGDVVSNEQTNIILSNWK